MITTGAPIFAETSHILNEGSSDTSAKRIGFLNRAARRVLRVRRWDWQKKMHDLTVSAGVQEYDLSSAISDYNPNWGIFEVYVGGEKISPIDYNNANIANSTSFYLKPDGVTIGFVVDLDGTENIDIWYYPRWVNITDENTVFNISLPEDLLGAICLLMKAMVHGAKRQRYDERNALIDYKEEIGELVLQDASPKIKDLPKNVPTILSYNRVKRSYVY